MLECTRFLNLVKDRSIRQILGTPDDLRWSESVPQRFAAAGRRHDPATRG